jgi:polygalacturonase
MASSGKRTKLAAFMAPLPLLALLFLSGALEAVVGASNGTSGDGASYTCSYGSPRSLASSSASQSVFSLDRYGARGDGRHDDTRALATAWKAACASPRPAVVLVPNGRRYLLKVVTLRGPCKSTVTVTVKGTLVASPNRADWSDRDRRLWIVFRSVNKLTLDGGGAIDGNGHKWWPHSCKINKALVSAAPMLRFISVIF